MDLKKILEHHNLTNFPAGLGGCRATNESFDSCDYDVTVFDGTSQHDDIISFEGKSIHIHHGSLNETKSDILIQYDNMQIIQDESWDLRMFLSKINEKRTKLYADYAKNCLIESIFCCQKCLDGIQSSNQFAACWQKCASFYLADAICALNEKRSSPSHMLDMMRKFEKTTTNRHISIINETVGIERATPTLLERMLKSTIGFSDIAENTSHSQAIQQKHDYFVKNSMLTDCYFYLGYLNKESFVKIKKTIDKEPYLIHILKVAFDIESDSGQLQQQSKNIEKSCRQILDHVYHG